MVENNTMRHATPKRIAAVATLIALCVALTACLLTPGKFTSQLDVRKEGHFSFSYSGEIYMLALSKFAGMGADNGAFTPSPCFKEDSSGERPCSQTEINNQKQQWEESRTASADKRKRDADMMKAMLGCGGRLAGGGWFTRVTGCLRLISPSPGSLTMISPSPRLNAFPWPMPLCSYRAAVTAPCG